MSRRNDLIVPSSEGEITDSWLLAALADPLPGVGCEAIRIERIGAEYGMASEILRCVFADDSIDEHNSVIIKLWPTNTSAGSAEASFYETFGNRIGARIPACFHAAVDSDRQRAVLVLEDIRDAVQGDCLQSLTAALAGDVARSLAGIHANWVGRPALQEAAWLRSFFPWEPAAAWFLSRRKAFLERYREKLDDFSRSLLSQIECAPAAVNERLAGAAITLLHGDLHLDNVLFQQGVPVILDWARCAKGPLALDLAELLFQIGEPADIDSTLEIYVESFQSRSTMRLNTHSIRRQLGGALLRQFTYRMCGIVNWQPDSRRAQMIIETDIQRSVCAIRYWLDQDPELFSFVH